MKDLIAKIGHFCENHVEKIVLVIAGVISVWLFFTRVIFSPNVVMLQGKNFTPGQIDQYVYEQKAQELSAELQRKRTGNSKVYTPKLTGAIDPCDPVIANVIAAAAAQGLCRGCSSRRWISSTPRGSRSSLSVGRPRDCRLVPQVPAAPDPRRDRRGGQPHSCRRLRSHQGDHGADRLRLRDLRGQRHRPGDGRSPVRHGGAVPSIPGELQRGGRAERGMARSVPGRSDLRRRPAAAAGAARRRVLGRLAGDSAQPRRIQSGTVHGDRAGRGPASGRRGRADDAVRSQGRHPRIFSSRRAIRSPRRRRTGSLRASMASSRTCRGRWKRRNAKSRESRNAGRTIAGRTAGGDSARGGAGGCGRRPRRARPVRGQRPCADGPRR